VRYEILTGISMNSSVP